MCDFIVAFQTSAFVPGSGKIAQAVKDTIKDNVTVENVEPIISLYSKLVGKLDKIDKLIDASRIEFFNTKKRCYKKDPYYAIAEAIFGDISEIVVGAKTTRYEGVWKKTKVLDLKKLIIFFDDCEGYSEELQLLLMHGQLLNRFSQCGFDVSLIFGSRYDYVTGRIDQQFRENIKFRKEIKRFSKAEVQEYLLEQERTGDGQKYVSTDVDRVFEITEGIPLLVSEADIYFGGGELSLRRIEDYLERITIWMDEEKRRFTYLMAFLDVVEMVTVKNMLNIDDDKAEEILEWFKKEPSVSTSENEKWLVKSVVARFIKISQKATSLEKYMENTRKAHAAKLAYDELVGQLQVL